MDYKKILFLSFYLLTLISCDSKMEDPLMDFKLSDSRDVWKNKLEGNIIKGEIQEGKNKFKYYFKKGDDSISSFVDYNVDGYNFGDLRSIKYFIGEDSIKKMSNNYNEFDRSFGSIDTATVFKLKNWLIELYGTPDDTVTVENSFDNYLKKSIGKKISKTDYHSFDFNSGSLIWNKDGYDVIFDKGRLIELSKNPEMKEYDKTSLVFKMKNYKHRIKQIADSIRSTLRPNDLIKVDFSNPRILKKTNYKYDFLFNIENFYRIGKEELRNVTNVNMDVVLTDEFDDEILRVEDSKFDLSDNPIKLKPGFHQYNTYRFSKNYYLNNTEIREKILKARQLYNDNKLNIRADVKAIIFEDGELLK